jgi:hypothetical protein
MTTQRHYDDDEISRLLSDLVPPPSLADPALLTGIRRTAARQQRRRQVGALAVVTTVALLAGFGTTLATGSTRASVVSPAVTTLAGDLGSLLKWPALNDTNGAHDASDPPGHPGLNRQNQASVLSRKSQAAWDKASGRHTDFRLLLSYSLYRDVIAVVEGRSMTGEARIAAFGGKVDPQTGAGSLLLLSDVPTPSPAPPVLVIATAFDPILLGLNVFKLQPADAKRRVRVHYQQTPEMVVDNLLSPSNPQINRVVSMAEFDQGSLTLLGEGGTADRLLRRITPDRDLDGRLPVAIWAP